MKLLDPSEVTQDKVKIVDQSKKTVHALADEEVKLVKRVNLLRTESEAEIKAIQENLELVRDEATLEIKKSVLFAEVTELENRKERALEPVKEIQAKVEQELEKTNVLFSNLNERDKTLTTKEKELVTKSSDLVEKEKDLLKKEKELGDREESIKASEVEIKKQAQEFGLEKADWQKKVDDEKLGLESRENALADREKVLTIRGKAQDQRDLDLNDLNRAILDKYATLERAIEESKKKHNI